MRRRVGAGRAGSRRHGNEAIVANDAVTGLGSAGISGGVIAHAVRPAGHVAVADADLDHDESDAGCRALPQPLRRIHRDPTDGLVSERGPGSVRAV